MSKLSSLIIITVEILPAYAAEPFRVVLTDSEQNIYKETFNERQKILQNLHENVFPPPC